jgi:hypothetical protein
MRKGKKNFSKNQQKNTTVYPDKKLLPADLLIALSNDPEVKLVARICPYQKDFELTDISLAGRGIKLFV